MNPFESAVSTATISTPMRDGVRLHGTLFLPRGAEEPLPVVMMRNPYNGAAGPAFWDSLCAALAGHGYAVVNQDVRGTAKSEGEFAPFSQEGRDGYDSVEWAAGQPWSNGRIGLWGISYLGVCVMQAAVLRPPHLVAGAAHFTGSDYHDHWTYDNGVFNDGFSNEWTAGFVRDGQLRRDRDMGPAADAATRPAFYDEWLAHPDFDAYWAAIDLESRYGEIDIPILMKGGWFDAFAAGTLRNFSGARAEGRGGARSATRLIMAPACHQPWNSRVITFPNAPEAMPDMDAPWWDEQLKDASAADEAAPVRLYVMAPPLRGPADDGYWIDSGAYPLPHGKPVRYALQSGGQGDGQLARDGASSGPPDCFVHDPAHPVPTMGGALVTLDPELPVGIVDQARLWLRRDVLTYTSPPFADEVAIVGPVTLVFWASSSATMTQFNAKLTVARDDGSVLNYLDRIVSSTLREGSRLAPSPAQPGVAHRYELELGHTALLLRPGMRLRIEIASSNFPRFALGAAGDVKADQMIFHDSAHPSWLEVLEIDPALLR
ncbi:MAG TPA: CocE/NonD family hydrolase [Ramlibacter sp.]|nr:CocE/NonD family hydrolase [Ramlibacter sp.]